MLLQACLTNQWQFENYIQKLGIFMVYEKLFYDIKYLNRY